MIKRRYTNMKALLPVIEQMIKAGMSHRQIEEELGLEGDRPVHNLLKRERKKLQKEAAGIVIRPKGRPRKDAPPRDIAAEQQYEINRLKMENKLLRDFLPVHRKEVRPKVKYAVIYRHREE